LRKPVAKTSPSRCQDQLFRLTLISNESEGDVLPRQKTKENRWRQPLGALLFSVGDDGTFRSVVCQIFSAGLDETSYFMTRTLYIFRVSLISRIYPATGYVIFVVRCNLHIVSSKDKSILPSYAKYITLQCYIRMYYKYYIRRVILNVLNSCSNISIVFHLKSKCFEKVYYYNYGKEIKCMLSFYIIDIYAVYFKIKLQCFYII